MLSQGFVLDSFGFPWSKELQIGTTPGLVLNTRDGRGKPDVDSNANAIIEDGRYGLMLFRRDRWRELTADIPSHDTMVRALYVIPETGTYGLQRKALRCALLQIDVQAHGGEAGTTKGPATDHSRVITMFGPTFSGSMDSIRQTMLDLGERNALRHIGSIRLLAASTTVDTNARIEQTAYLSVGTDTRNAQKDSRSTRSDTKEESAPIQYVPMALTDRRKLDYLSRLGEVLGVAPDRVAIVYESTTFGIEACKMLPGTRNRASDLCRSALMLPMPVNIADVRFGLRAKIAAHARDNKSQITLPHESTHLPLEDGAENGGEFPESQQSPLTASSTALELERLIEALTDRRAQLVVIIATDVRDRLFLIEQINSRVNGALFVDMDTDRLLGHPDFIHATRGTLTLSSAQLTQKNANAYTCNQKPQDQEPCQVIRVWSTDEQAMLAGAMDYWRSDSVPRPPGIRGNPLLYVVSRAGLVSDPDLGGNKALRKAEIICSAALAIVFAVIGIVVCNGGVTGPAVRSWSWPIAAGVLVRLALGLLAAALLWLVTGSIVVGGLTGIVGLYVVGFPGGGAPRWSCILIWIGSAMLLLTAALETIASIRWLSRAWTQSEMLQLLIALSASASGGMSYPLAECVAVLAVIVAMLIAPSCPDLH